MNTYKNIYIGLKDLSDAEKAYMRGIDFNTNTVEFPKMTLPELRACRVAYSLRLREINRIRRTMRNKRKVKIRMIVETEKGSGVKPEVSTEYELPDHTAIKTILSYRSRIEGRRNLLDYYIRKRAI